LALGLDIYLGVVLVFAVVLITVLMLGRRGRGRLIECPQCGAEFKRPAYAEKSVGFGPSLPGIGSFTCPKCNYRGRANSFKYVKANGSNPSGK
jgi:predicted RNA-binding Zn-ribbon protein involved in translation (DUF1610 family)